MLVDLLFCVKLADFGCARRGAGTRSMTMVGTLHWMAPEVVRQDEGHGRKADIWSLGCVVVEMATAADPWGHGAFDNIMHAMNVVGLSGASPPVPSGLPPGGEDFLQRCFQQKPDERPWASELLLHEFAHGGDGGG